MLTHHTCNSNSKYQSVSKMWKTLSASRCVAKGLTGAHPRTLATVSSRTLQAIPLTDSNFGAEVQGVDFSRPLSPPIVAEIIDLQNKYGVLAFRSTGLNDETHVRYSKNFGALESIHGLNKPRRASSNHLYDAGNLDAEGNIIPKGSRAWWHAKGNGLWHTDSSFNQHRSSYSALRAVELPPQGGQTLYADMRQAYADLPEDIKSLIEGKIAEHWIWHSRKLAAPEEFVSELLQGWRPDLTEGLCRISRPRKRRRASHQHTTTSSKLLPTASRRRYTSPATQSESSACQPRNQHS